MQGLMEEKQPVGCDHTSGCVPKRLGAFRGWGVEVPEGYVGVRNYRIGELREEESGQCNGSIKEDFVFGPDVGLGEA